MNDLTNKAHPLFQVPKWMENVELVTALDNKEVLDLKASLDQAENVYKKNLAKKQEVLQRTLLNESELRVKRRALQMDQLDSEEQSLLLYAFQKEKELQSKQNDELKQGFDKIQKEDAQLQASITEIHLALKSISSKYSNRHKKEYPVDQIYERFKKDRNKCRCFYSYASATHMDLFHGFLHVFEDEIVFESVILKDQVLRLNVTDIVWVHKRAMYESEDRIDLHTKGGDVMTFFGMKGYRDEVAECIINALALLGQE